MRLHSTPLALEPRRLLSHFCAIALCLSWSLPGAVAQELPPAEVNILGWPRMAVPTFGCLLERTFGHRDARFNCDLVGYQPTNDPCGSEAYYEGPSIPETLARRIHPFARMMRVDYEHGLVREVSLYLEGKPGDEAIRKAFHLPFALVPKGYKNDFQKDDSGLSRGLPSNLAYVDVQRGNSDIAILSFIGFEHMGAGDVDCSRRQ